jgi:hypothetical protein
MADKNGDGIVYHRSDCGEDNVRMYGAGGDLPGSMCGTWGLSPQAIKYIHDHPEKNHRFEDVILIDPIVDVVKEGYELIKDGVTDVVEVVKDAATDVAKEFGA